MRLEFGRIFSGQVSERSVGVQRDLQDELDRLAAAALARPSTAGPLDSGGDEHTVGAVIAHARGFAPVHELAPETRRAKGMKKFLLRLSRLFLSRQASYNVALVDSVTMLNQQLAALRSREAIDSARISAVLSSIRRDIERFDREVEERLGLLDEQYEVSRTTQDGLGALSNDFANYVQATNAARDSLHAQMRVVRSEIDMLVDDLRKTMPPGVDEKTIRTLADAADTRADAFYERFEDTFRGSQDDIRGRLSIYIDVLQERLSASGDVIDLGSGRGEWLELLDASGYSGCGVDINQVAVSSCIERGLSAVRADCLAYLRGSPTESVAAVTSFHLVEHMPVEARLELIEQAFRVIKPGGLLILETPNPTNLRVGASTFYLDPTHDRPIHPDVLAFMVRDAGFAAIETRFLHPRENFSEDDDLSEELATDLASELMWSIRGPQDFAVIARKPSAPARESS
jgi:SAM-dependent methyltransferase